MVLREIDKSTIYIAHLIGYDSNNKPIYTKPIETKAQISQNIKGEITNSKNGVSENYDLKLTIELNNINRYINEQTVFWVNTSAVDKDFNFIPIKISEWYRNLKTIHLKSVQINWDSVWCYSKQYGFYEIQCYLDEQNLCLRLPKDSFYNNSITDKIWKYLPNDENETEGLFYVNEYYELQDEIIYILSKGD